MKIGDLSKESTLAMGLIGGAISSSIALGLLAAPNYLINYDQTMKKMGREANLYLTRSGPFHKSGLINYLENPCEDIMYIGGFPFSIPGPIKFVGFDINGDGILDTGIQNIPEENLIIELSRQNTPIGLYINGDDILNENNENIPRANLRNLEYMLSKYEIPFEVQQGYADLRESRGLNEYCNR